NRLYPDLRASGRPRDRQSPGLKPRTVRYIHTIIHAALDDAVRWRHIALNAADQANPPAAAQAKSPEMRIWTAAQVGRFLDLTEGDRYQFSWLFLFTTGFRRAQG